MTKAKPKSNAVSKAKPISETVADLPAPDPRTKAAMVDSAARYVARRPRAAVKMTVRDNGALVVETPHADQLGWQDQLVDAFGTPSQEFANYALHALSNAMAKRGRRVDQETLNASLAILDGIRPQNEVEALLAVQMAATHTIAMDCLSNTRRADMLNHFEANGSLANKFLRTFAVQMETLSRVRRGGKQKVEVTHVHVGAGGKAAVGTFVQQPLAGGGAIKYEGQAHDAIDPRALAFAPSAPLWSQEPVGRNVRRPSALTAFASAE